MAVIAGAILTLDSQLQSPLSNDDSSLRGHGVNDSAGHSVQAGYKAQIIVGREQGCSKKSKKKTRSGDFFRRGRLSSPIDSGQAPHLWQSKFVVDCAFRIWHGMI